MRRVAMVCGLLVLLSGIAHVGWGQGSLSEQVLRLLTRVNSWTATNSYSDLRVPAAAIPSTTTDRLYADLSHNLYFNGGLVAGAGGSLTPHNLLSTSHADTSAAAAVRAAVL